MRRIFWFGIAWPLFELIFAVLIIGLVICHHGHHRLNAQAASRPTSARLGTHRHQPAQSSGSSVCGFIAGGNRPQRPCPHSRLARTRPVLLAMRIPVLGKCLESLALSRLTWALGPGS